MKFSSYRDDVLKGVSIIFKQFVESEELFRI